jgi:UDP-N-acetylmuramoyl-tripeptide--D-alanyl-D-alanine ligase
MMEARSLRFVTEACSGVQLSGSPDTLVRRVCTDSRHTQPGDLFFALSGETFDGHNFLADACRKGAVALVAEHGKTPSNLAECPIISVKNTRAALGQLAAAYRKDFGTPIIAVGGSNGKTTTKELIAAVLRQQVETVWSEASFNNEIGVPLTLLKLERNHQALVQEVGTNHPGELAPLVRIVAPKYGVITSIGREHLEFFGDLAGVAKEEGSLAELLPADGVLFINGDSEWAEAIVQRTKARVISVGFDETNHWRATSVRLDKLGATFGVHAPVKEYSGEYRIHLLGRHQVLNALLAIAVGVELGLERAAIEAGLADCKPAKMRLQLWEFNGVRVLDDTYNANADSMIAALQTLRDFPCKGRRVAVLGDMAELGPQCEATHEEVGRRVAELGVAQLFAVGKMAAAMGRGARAAGLNRVFEFVDVDAAASALKQFLRQGDVVLLKASRVSRLERITEKLRNKESLKRN